MICKDYIQRVCDST